MKRNTTYPENTEPYFDAPAPYLDTSANLPGWPVCFLFLTKFSALSC